MKTALLLAILPLAILTVPFLVACRSGGRPPPAAGLRIEPDSAQLYPHGAQRFHAYASDGRAVPAVWSVRNSRGEPSEAGKVTPDGVYTHGSALGRYYYIRAARADAPEVFDTAKVEVVPEGGEHDGYSEERDLSSGSNLPASLPEKGLWVEPVLVQIYPHGSASFHAYGRDREPANVVWSVRNSGGEPSDAGTITADGVYTHAAAFGRYYYIRAARADDPGVFVTARVEVVP